MIDVNFWAVVASRWVSVLDMAELERIRTEAARIAEETIGKEPEKLLDVLSALDDY